MTVTTPMQELHSIDPDMQHAAKHETVAAAVYVIPVATNSTPWSLWA